MKKGPFHRSGVYLLYLTLLRFPSLMAAGCVKYDEACKCSTEKTKQSTHPPTYPRTYVRTYARTHACTHALTTTATTTRTHKRATPRSSVRVSHFLVNHVTVALSLFFAVGNRVAGGGGGGDGGGPASRSDRAGTGRSTTSPFLSVREACSIKGTGEKVLTFCTPYHNSYNSR